MKRDALAEYIVEIKQKICQIFTHINIACLCLILMFYTQMNFIHSQFIYFFENAWIFLWIFFEPNGAKGKLPSSILIALYTTIHFTFLYAYVYIYIYIYGNGSRIFINGSLFRVSKKLCLIVNLVFILMGPKTSSIHRQEEKKMKRKEMRYKCIHFFLILCAIDCEKRKKERRERIWKIYII